MRVLSLAAAVQELKATTPNGSVTALSIRDYVLSFEDIKMLGYAIRGSKVEILMLNAKNLDDGSVSHLVEHGLLDVEDEDDEPAPPLRVLSVTKNNLTAKSAVVLAKLIATSSTLKRLYLSGNPELLGDAASLAVLEQAAYSSNSLTVLDVGNATVETTSDIIARIHQHTESNQRRILQEEEQQGETSPPPPPPPIEATSPPSEDGEELNELQKWQQRRSVVIVDDDDEEECDGNHPPKSECGSPRLTRQYQLLESTSSLRHVLASTSSSQRSLMSGANDDSGGSFPLYEELPNADGEDKHPDDLGGANDEQSQFLQEVKESLQQSHPEMYDLFVDVLRNAKTSMESYNDNGNNTDWMHQRVEFIFQNHPVLLQKFQELMNLRQHENSPMKPGRYNNAVFPMDFVEKSNPVLFHAKDEDLLMSAVTEEEAELVEEDGTTSDTKKEVSSMRQSAINHDTAGIQDFSPRGVAGSEVYVDGKGEEGDEVSKLDDGRCTYAAPLISEPISAESLALLDKATQNLGGPSQSATVFLDDPYRSLEPQTATETCHLGTMRKSASMSDSVAVDVPRVVAQGSPDTEVQTPTQLNAAATSLSGPAAIGRSTTLLTAAPSVVEGGAMTNFQNSEIDVMPSIDNQHKSTSSQPADSSMEVTPEIFLKPQNVQKAVSFTEPSSRASFLVASTRTVESLPEMSGIASQAQRQVPIPRRFLSTVSSLGLEKAIELEEQETEDVLKGRALMKRIFFSEESMNDDEKSGTDSDRSVSNRDIDDPDGDGPPFEFPVEYLEMCTSQFSDDTRLGKGAFGEVFCGTDRLLRRRFAVKRVALDLVSEERPSGRKMRSSKSRSGTSSGRSSCGQSSGGASSTASESQDEEQEEDDSFEEEEEEDDEKLVEVRRSIQRELLTLSHFRHPNMANLYGYYLSPEMRGRHYLVYEYASYGSLDKFLGANHVADRERLSWDQRIRVALDVATALNYLHKGGSGYTCFHRDIKSANICLKMNFSAKLIDCGLSKMVPTDGSVVGPSIMNSSGAAVFGTSGYLCPKYSQGGRQYIAAFDVFSYGMVLIELITGHLQFGTTSDGTRLNFYDMYVEADDCAAELENAKDEYAGDWDPDILREFCSIASKCVKMKPPDRPKTDTIVRSLRSIVNRLNDQDVVTDGDHSSRIQRKEAETEENSNAKGIGTEDSNHHVPIEVKGQCSCCLLDDVVGLKCRRLRHPHFVCKDCMEDHVWESLGAPNITCPISGCRSGPFTDKEIGHAISVPLVNLHRQEQGRKRQVEMLSTMSKNHKENVELHLATRAQLNRMEDLLQQSLSTLASMKEGNAKGCPSLVMVVPPAATEKNANGLFPNPFERIQSLYKTRIDLFFVCEKSFTAIDPPIRLKVTKEWMAKLAPVLKAGMFVLQTAILAARIATGFPLPMGFSYGTEDTGEQLELINDMVDDMLGGETRESLRAAQPALAPQKPGEATTTAKSIPGATKRLIGDAYSLLCEKALKPKNSGWKDKICPVLDEGGNVIWVKKELEDDFKKDE